MLHSPFGVNMLIQETNNFSNVISEQPTSSKNDSCCCKGRKCDCASKQGGCRSVTLRPKSSSSPHLVGSNKKILYEIDGTPEQLMIRIPEKFPHGGKLRIKGKGHSKHQKRGDLILQVKVSY